MSSITINGNTIKGNSITINNGRITVDGVEVNTGDQKQISIHVEGSIDQISADSCQEINVTGSAGSIKTMSGNVKCGDVYANVSTMSGDVKCSAVHGSVSTMSGDVIKA